MPVREQPVLTAMELARPRDPLVDATGLRAVLLLLPRSLPLVEVARDIGCTPSTLSKVRTGQSTRTKRSVVMAFNRKLPEYVGAQRFVWPACPEEVAPQLRRTRSNAAADGSGAHGRRVPWLVRMAARLCRFAV